MAMFNCYMLVHQRVLIFINPHRKQHLRSHLSGSCQAIATMKGKTVEDLIAEFARSNKDKDLAWTTGNHGETTGNGPWKFLE